MARFTKKKVVAVAATAVLAVSAGAAYAYWTNSGSGTGDASTGNNTAITVNQTSVVSALAPGLAAQPLSGNFTNPNSSPVYVASVTATVASTDKVGCDASDYTVVQPTAVNAQVASGTGVGSWSGGSIQFNNKANANQDACKGATVTISYTSN